MYREGPLTAVEVAGKAQAELSGIEATLERLVEGGLIQRVEHEGVFRYRASALAIPLGAPVGWEAAVFDHFKALVTTVLSRLSEDRTTLDDPVGGSTYTIEVWPGHPLAEEVYGTLGRFRSLLGDLRARAAKLNGPGEVPDQHTRVVIYVGQCLINEGTERGA
jgi:hypothetical protein